MSYTKTFTVPAFYKKFSCKCGDCRHTCCQMWKIGLSLDEYNRLIGLECNEELRRKLDGVANIELSPTPEKYASITERPDGFCPVLLDSGFCALHRAMGEDALPKVCRYYPRSPRCHNTCDCSCSDGCEAVDEALFKEDKVEFDTAELTFDLDIEDKNTSVDDKEYAEIREKCISVLNENEKTLCERIKAVGKLLRETYENDIETKIKSENPEKSAVELQNLLNGFFGKDSPNLGDYSLFTEAVFCGTDDERETENGGELWFIPSCGYENRAFIPSGNPEKKNFKTALKLLYEKYPAFDRMTGNVLINHIFYTGFPFYSGSKVGAYAGLCAAYGLLRYICAGCLTDKCSENGDDIANLADVFSAFFRMAEGSTFVQTAPKLLEKHGYLNYEILNGIIEYL